MPPRSSRLPPLPPSVRPPAASPVEAVAPPSAPPIDPAELASLRSQLEEARRAILIKEAETWSLIAQRDARIAEVETLRAEAATRTAKVEELETLQRKLADREVRISELEDIVKARDEKIAKLEIDVAAVRSQGGEPSDDLKQIRGIGPAFERELKRLGVRTFAQIAAWTPEDIDAIAPKIKARPERIRREGWVTSAAERTAATKA